MAGRRKPGGIIGLLDLIEKHRGALRYDWRTRFGTSLDLVPGDIGWSEALDLVRILRADPGSMLAAAMEGWSYPMPREVAVLADLYDLQYAKTGVKNRKPYPRPFKMDDREITKRGNAGGRSREQVIEILREYGHGAPV